MAKATTKYLAVRVREEQMARQEAMRTWARVPLANLWNTAAKYFAVCREEETGVRRG